jgi:O-acetyl-ADP-ribose deacetylase (regulator of RNase III)
VSYWLVRFRTRKGKRIPRLTNLDNFHVSGQISTYLGDITTLRVDAIVNAANPALARGGGVCGAIFAAAGPDLDAACAGLGPCATGDAVATPGFRLPARFVIHAVGPVWRGGDHEEPRLLASAYRRSLEVARAIGARSLAFPAISTGIYGYPPDAAAEIAVRTLEAWAGDLEVTLVAFDAATERRYVALLG